jgi:hypothetical protein
MKLMNHESKKNFLLVLNGKSGLIYWLALKEHLINEVFA